MICFIILPCESMVLETYEVPNIWILFPYGLLISGRTGPRLNKRPTFITDNISLREEDRGGGPLIDSNSLYNRTNQSKMPSLKSLNDEFIIVLVAMQQFAH